MGKLLALILGAGVIFGVAYYELKGSVAATTGGASAPKETLDRWNDKARDIEKDTQKRADDMMKRTE